MCHCDNALSSAGNWPRPTRICVGLKLTCIRSCHTRPVYSYWHFARVAKSYVLSW